MHRCSRRKTSGNLHPIPLELSILFARLAFTCNLDQHHSARDVEVGLHQRRNCLFLIRLLRNPTIACGPFHQGLAIKMRAIKRHNAQMLEQVFSMYVAGVGHIVTMARDKWGSLVLASALSYVDDTVLLRKCILPELQVNPS